MQQLTYQDVLTILRLIDSGPFERFEVEFEGTKLAVTRAAQAAATPADVSRAEPSTTGSAPAPAKPAEAVQASPSTPTDEVDEVPGAEAVRSPMAGTFYAAPSPGAPAFVEVGSTVRKGDQIGTVEVMKLFTAIHAPFDGIVRAIAVRNEALVEKDGTIMWIESADGPHEEK